MRTYANPHPRTHTHTHTHIHARDDINYYVIHKCVCLFVDRLLARLNLCYVHALTSREASAGGDGGVPPYIFSKDLYTWELTNLG